MTVVLAHRESGRGLPLVMLHAFPLDARLFAEQHGALPARLITPDLRGFGSSPLGFDQPAIDRMAGDVIDLCDRLELERVVLGGVSLGGYVAMAVLRRHPERVMALVLADTKAGADPDATRVDRERIAAGVLADGNTRLVMSEVYPPLLGSTTQRSRPTVVARVRDMAESAAPAAVAWAERAMAGRPESFPVLRYAGIPALVAVGEEDLMAPLAEAERMAEALGESTTLAVIPGSGHLSPIEAPDGFNRAVSGFLGRL